MLTTIGNFHHHKLPKIGSRGRLILGYDQWRFPRYFNNDARRVVVESYPLCDNIRPWSIGIHTFYARYVGTNKVVRLSGIYFVEDD